MKAFLTIAYGAVLLAVASSCYRQPEFNWDMLPYAALALSYDDPDPDAFHAMTYAQAQDCLPPAKFGLLVDSVDAYRFRAFRDPQFFAAQLPLYAIKPGFVRLIYGFYRLGVPLPLATVLPSVLSFLAIGIVLLFWVRRVLPEPYATAVSLAAALTPFVLQGARASTPDMLTGFLLLLAVFLLHEKRMGLAGLATLAFAVAVRVDAVMFVLVLAVYVYATRSTSTPRLLAAVALMVGFSAFIVVRNIDSVGQFFFIRSAAERLGSAPSQPFFQSYLHGVWLGLTRLSFSSIAILAGAACVTLYARKTTQGSVLKDPAALLVVLVLVHIVARFIVHPIIEDRFLIADYLVLAMMLVEAISGLLRSGPPGVHQSPLREKVR